MQKQSYIFPDNFLWGGAASGPQTEGRAEKPHRNVFDYWYDTAPEVFWGRVGPNETCDSYHCYRADLALMKEIGFNSFRTSLQWTRLIRDFETGEPDERGARFYSDMIDAALACGIEPILNLHHFDLPYALYQRYGGWNSRHVTTLFTRFAETAFRLYGDRVKRWSTFNEPMVVVEGQYLYGFHYPCLTHGGMAMQALYHLNLASALAIEAFRRIAPTDGKIGIILNLTPTYPRGAAAEDRAAARAADIMFNRSFLDPAVRGTFPDELVQMLDKDGVLWRAEAEDQTLFADNTVDFLGVNYYHPKRVQAREQQLENQPWMPERYFAPYALPDARINPYRGWEIYPDALYDIAVRIKDEYGNIPWYVAENGMGVEDEARFMGRDRVIDDHYRIAFYTDHLKALHRGIQAGSNCFGFHAWTPIDCWSWLNAYKNRYGFIAAEPGSTERHVKRSGKWFHHVATRNGLVEP